MAKPFSANLPGAQPLHSYARTFLQRPDAVVADVASACGFVDVNLFAREYREVFSERPSETLARGAGIGA